MQKIKRNIKFISFILFFFLLLFLPGSSISAHIPAPKYLLPFEGSSPVYFRDLLDEVNSNLSKSKLVEEPVSTFSNNTYYVANTPEECPAGSIPDTDCFFNSPFVDDTNGIGTGLRDAVDNASAGDAIIILNDYFIKSNTVSIDEAVIIRGHEQASISYDGTNCSMPMLSLTAGVTLTNLTITDGNCAPPGRDLIIIDSPENTFILHNTIQGGNQAVTLSANTGKIVIAFNHITNNSGYAIQALNSEDAGNISIFANNLLENNSSNAQADCADRGSADHNFLGEGESVSDNVENCQINNGKHLGAAILISSSGNGVQAISHLVTDSMTYAFDQKIGARHVSGKDFEIIIVNHGQGSLANIPFRQDGARTLHACSNFYDIFIAEDQDASDLVLALRYDLNSNCIRTIESSAYCGSGNNANNPLWWFDPSAPNPKGWIKTGSGTTCNTSTKEIRLLIENNSQPAMAPDLNFTPFVVGVPIMFSDFTAVYSDNSVNLQWATISEHGIQEFYVQRRESETGSYARITPGISAFGGPFIGGIYQFTDTNISFNRSYYYRIEVVDASGTTIHYYGPVTIRTSTPTPTITLTLTATQTKTPTPSRTPVPFVYRTPTTYFRRFTPNPGSAPTQVRTYGPSPTGTLTFVPVGQTPDYFDPWGPDSGYPVDPNLPESTAGYPPPDTENGQDQRGTPQATPDQDNDQDQLPPGGSEKIENEGSGGTRWIFLWLGAAAGLSLLGTISLILVKTKLF